MLPERLFDGFEVIYCKKKGKNPNFSPWHLSF